MELRWEHTNGPSIWIGMDTTTRQVIVCYPGHPRPDHARELWGNIAVKDSQDVTYDPHFSEKDVTPAEPHQTTTTNAWKTYRITRSHTMTREDVYCLVRATQSFSTS
jgi:IS1 family transposase